MRIYRPPKIFHYLYPGAIFRLSTPEPKVYLSFDDGPTPGVSEAIASLLLKHNVPAIFFVSGKNAESYPSLFESIRNEGFGIGNHGYDHIKGLFRDTDSYIEDAKRGAKISKSQIFRPAYGAITPAQFRRLKTEYKVVFWDLMPYDFDKRISPNRVPGIISRKIRNGSIIVLHDNLKSCIPLVLPDVINMCRDRGFVFGDLSLDLNNTA